MALRAVPDHPKFAHLKTLLALPKGALLGWLEAVWHFTGRFTPQGNIGKYTDREIEAWVEWNGEPGALVAALTESKWLQPDDTHRLLVHDWHEHADKATKQSLKNKKLEFCVPSVRRVGTQLEHTMPLAVQVCDDLEHTIASAVQVCAPPVPEPVPEPEPEPVPGAVPVPGNKSADTPPDSADNRILCETLGIFDMREQSAVFLLYKKFAESEHLGADAACEHIVSRWHQLREESPNLDWTWGSAYKFLMSGKWNDPRTWPRGKVRALSDVPRASTDDEFAARERQRDNEAREAFQMWQGMSEGYRQKNPWKGPVFSEARQ